MQTELHNYYMSVIRTELISIYKNTVNTNLSRQKIERD